MEATDGSAPQDWGRQAIWVGWRYGELRDSESYAKVPINPSTGRNADVSDPRTWGTLDEATEYAKTGKVEGIGFIVVSPTVVIDLDKCRDPETGSITPEAQDIVWQFESYTEVSPSGKGLHIIVRGEWPTRGNRTLGIEVYASGRFLTFTGNQLPGTPSTIKERSAELAVLYAERFGKSQTTRDGWAADEPVETFADEEILAKCRRGRNAAKFKALWEGETSAYDGDESKADMALVRYLSRWTHNHEQLGSFGPAVRALPWEMGPTRWPVWHLWAAYHRERAGESGAVCSRPCCVS